MLIRCIALALALTALLAACTDASLYSTAGSGANLPDRATFEGVMCAPSPTGRHYPTRLLFAVEGGTGVSADVRARVVDALTAAVQRFVSPSMRYGLIGYNGFAFSLLPDGFGDSEEFASALTRYTSFNQDGPLSLASALEIAEALLSGEMINTCPGTRARTRYAVVLITFDADPTATCGALPVGDSCRNAAQCGQCLALQRTDRLRALAARYGAGAVTVHPIYITRDTPSDTARAQVAAIASSAASHEVVADLDSMKPSLLALPVLGLDGAIGLRTVLAFNRHARARGGELLPDTDGDGVPDADEVALGTDPANPDSDGEGLMDGVELLVGLDPRTADVVRGCNAFSDADRDGLTECEERLLGTSDCMGDSDGDGIPDLVEVLSGSNPLEPEQARDTDRDGVTNLDELRGHSDPLSVDLGYSGSRSYSYEQEALPIPAAGTMSDDPCPGQPRFRVRVSNIGLVATGTPPGRAPGTNDIYFYLVFAREGGTGLDSLARWRAEPVTFVPPHRTPATPVIPLAEDSFETRP